MPKPQVSRLLLGKTFFVVGCKLTVSGFSERKRGVDVPELRDEFGVALVDHVDVLQRKVPGPKFSGFALNRKKWLFNLKQETT